MAKPKPKPAAEKAAHKIPPNLEPAILEQAGLGKSLRQICDWLASTHDVHVGPTSIRKKLAKGRAERDVVAKAIVREKLAKTVLSDIDVLELEKRRLRKLARLHFEEAIHGVNRVLGKSSTELYCLVTEHLRKVVDTKLHYSGADTPDDGVAELLAAERALASGMAGVAERLRQAGVLPQPERAGEGEPQ